MTCTVCSGDLLGNSSSSTAAVSMPVSLLDLSAEELIDRGIAPIKKEYRLGAIRYLQTRQEAAGAADPPAAAQEAAAASTGAPGAADTTADDALEAEGPAAAGAGQSSSRSAPAVAADGEGGHKRTKSKRQRKKASGKRPIGVCMCFFCVRGPCADPVTGVCQAAVCTAPQRGCTHAFSHLVMSSS